MGEVATYSCLEGHELRGDEQRNCQSDGTWSGDEPFCQSRAKVALSFECGCEYHVFFCTVIDCGPLSNPDNGQVEFDSTTVGEVATYSCLEGHELRGDEQRNCQSDGTWSGDEPFCQSRAKVALSFECGCEYCVFLCTVVDCGNLLSPSMGSVTFSSGMTFGSTASFECDSGYMLVGEEELTCQADGQWSGEEPICMCKETATYKQGTIIID